MRSLKLMIGLFGLAAVATAAPMEISSDGLSLDTKVAAAKPGKGKGRGNGRGLGRGLSEQGAQGLANGESENGPSHGQGQANGRALGHVDKDAVSGVEHAPPGQAKKDGYDGVKGNLGVKGSFNAIHSAAINKGVVSPNSRVARVKAYLDAAQEVSDIEASGQGDLQAAIEAAAMAAADASSQTVTSDMLGSVHDYSNGRALTEPGIDMSDDTRDEVADEARDIQSGS